MASQFGVSARLLALVSLAGLMSGCTGASPGQHVVFPVTTNARWFGGDNIDAITDVGIPLYKNLKGSTVKLLSVQLADAPPELHMRSVDAYSTRGLPYSRLPLERGSLPAECPRFFGHPRPVTSVAVPPKAQANWIITIVFTISKPGRYHFRRAKINYSINGAKGWQYQNLNVTIDFKPPPDRRLRIEPRTELC